MRTRLLALITIALLVSLPVPSIASGDQAAQEPRVEIVHDLGPNATAYVGDVTTFSWVLFEEDGKPSFHQNAEMQVRLNGVTVLKTSPSSGHDYDGVDPYHVTFTQPGTYQVTVTVYDSGSGPMAETVERTAQLTGKVAEPTVHPATLSLEAPEEAQAGDPVELTYQVTDEQGEIVEHTDVDVRIRQPDKGLLTFQTRTHGHQGQHGLTHVFEAPGTYEVVLTAHPRASQHSGEIPATVTTKHTVQVSQAPSDPGAPPWAQVMGGENVAHRAETTGPYELWATYDPFTAVGPYGRMTLETLAVHTETGQLANDATYTATLAGPDGKTLFHSNSLHEADGILEVATQHPDPGEYTLTVEAQGDGWSGTITHTYRVRAPLPERPGYNAGPILTSLDVPSEAKAGQPTQLILWAKDAAGVPFMHGELGVRVLDQATGAPLYQGKLHTHANGSFPLTVAFPEAGTYTVEVDPTPTEPTATPSYHGPEIGTPPVFDVQVAQGPGIPAIIDEPIETTQADPDQTPGPGLAVIAAVLAAMAVAAARRG